jgi:hypothetical protein
MNLHGRVQNGVVVLEGGLRLPEGTAVTVSCIAPTLEPTQRRDRLDFPLVRSAKPGSLNLTGDQIAEILEEDDVSS